jgi:hypothetical protein
MRLSGFSARAAVRAPIYLVAALLAGGSLLAASGPPQAFHLPLAFEQNQGQFAPQVKWTGRSPGYEVLFDDESATIIIPDKTTWQTASKLLPGAPLPRRIPYSAVRMKLVGSRPWNEISGAEPTGGVSNYVNTRDLKRPHDVKNLFLCDGNSLVTSDRGQPTMTIQALAYRAADRITALARRSDLYS